MAQLVFVHGVANRGGVENDAAVANRTTMFKKLLFTGTPSTIRSPAWGDLIPDINQQVFTTEQTSRSLSLNIPDDRAPVKHSLELPSTEDPLAVLDELTVNLVSRADRERRELTSQELQLLANIIALIESGQAAALFAENRDTVAIEEALRGGMPATLSISSKLGQAFESVVDRLSNVGGKIINPSVQAKRPDIALFISDVLVYLREGEKRDLIRQRVVEQLRLAHQAKDGPLILVGHSMGGVILTDLLSNPAAAGLPADFQADALFTVGSQPGLFASLGLLGDSDTGTALRPKPAAVQHWLNVFDPIDPLAFRAAPLFSGVEDLIFSAIDGPFDTHGAYFKRAQFYVRARQHLLKWKLLSA